MSARWALFALLLDIRIPWCIAIRHDEEEEATGRAFLGPPQPAVLLQGNESMSMASVLADLEVLCGSVKHFGIESYKLHCDQHLQKIRDVFKVPSPEEILESNNINLDKAEEGSGKSGAKMLFSNDKKYIIKTMSARDIRALTPAIHKYTMHILNHASTSLMMRFYALMEDSSGQFWIISNNWLPVNFPIVWDLKGSTAGRSNGLHDHGQKDNDWTKAGKEIALAPAQRTQVLGALESDSKMLSDVNLIDYSLITGLLVYALSPCNGQGQPSCVAPVCHPTAGCGETAYKLGDYFNLIPQVFCHGEHPKPPQLELGTKCTAALTTALTVHVACFGMIDLLKPYDAKSKAEYVVTLGAFGRGVSVQPAEGYAERFFHFMHSAVFPKKASEGTVELTFDSKMCKTWGSRQEEDGGFPVVTTVVLIVLVAGGVSLAAWYYMSQSPPSPPASGSAPALSDPSQSAYPQGYAGDLQGAHPEGYPQHYQQGDQQGYGGYAGGYGSPNAWAPASYPPPAYPA